MSKTISQTLAGHGAGDCWAIATDLAQPLLQTDVAKMDHTQDMAAVEFERFKLVGGVAFVTIKGLLTPNAFAYERWMGWSTYAGLVDTFEQLTANADVSEVAVLVDSPGGQVLGIDAAVNAIAACAAVKPVKAFVNPMAASAAYWLVSQATEITMAAGAIVGSVGIVTGASVCVQAGQMSGVQHFEFASSHAGAKKPDPSTEKGQALIQARLDDAEVKFHAAIAKGRKIDAADLLTRLTKTGDIADGGGVFEVADAVRLGLADQEMSQSAWMTQFVTQSPRITAKRRASYAAQADAAMAIASI